MTIAIIGAMPEEIEFISENLKNLKPVPLDAFDVFANEEVVLAQSRVGKVNAAAAATWLIQQYAPKAILSIGSAGGLHPDLNVGDLVISEMLSYHDVDNRIWDYEFGQVPKMPARYEGDRRLMEQAIQAFDVKDHQLMAGLITSGDTFMADPDAVAMIRKHFPDVCAVDMESCAIAQVCHLFQTPFLSIRAITDTADDASAAASNDEHLAFASERAARLTLQLLQKISKA